MDLVQTILIVSLLVVVSVYTGYNVQKISHFLRPKDFITIAIFTAIAVCAFGSVSFRL